MAEVFCGLGLLPRYNLWKEKASPWVPKVSLTERVETKFHVFFYLLHQGTEQKAACSESPHLWGSLVAQLLPAPSRLSTAAGNLTILLIYAKEHLWFLIPDGPHTAWHLLLVPR